MSSTEKKKAESYGRIVLQVFLTGLAYYLATEIAWALCFPNSKVSLLFPPHAVLVVILLLVPTRHWSARGLTDRNKALWASFVIETPAGRIYHVADSGYGDGHHFRAVVVSDKFAGLSRIKQHQLVYQVLGDRMREQIHALSMKTLTPAEWASSPESAAVTAKVAANPGTHPHH